MTDEDHGLDKREAEVVTARQQESESDFDTPPPKVMREMLATFGMISGGKSFHPIFEKFNDGHVDKFLDQSHAEDMGHLKYRLSNRWFALIYVTLGASLMVFLVVFLLPDNKELLAEILKIGLAAAGGFGGGYGFKAHLDSRRRDS